MSVQSRPRIFEPTDDEVAAYRGLSSLAVAGLLLGMCSPLAMLSPILLLAPLAAIVVSCLALRQIAAQAPNLVGRKAALAGLLLGTAFLVAAPADDMIYRYYIRGEARKFADDWIKAVRSGEVYAAHDLTIEPHRRAPLDKPLSKYYAESDFPKHLLWPFLDQPIIRTLFALGSSAEYRPYETAAENKIAGGDAVDFTYAVTYTDEESHKKTFFFTLAMARTIDPDTGRCDWVVTRVDGPVKPSGW